MWLHLGPPKNNSNMMGDEEMLCLSNLADLLYEDRGEEDFLRFINGIINRGRNKQQENNMKDSIFSDERVKIPYDKNGYYALIHLEADVAVVVEMHNTNMQFCNRHEIKVNEASLIIDPLRLQHLRRDGEQLTHIVFAINYLRGKLQKNNLLRFCPEVRIMPNRLKDTSVRIPNPPRENVVGATDTLDTDMS